jgi:DNA-binding transcriptional ArsR family regulator
MKTSSPCSCGPRCSCKNCACGPTARCFDALGNETRLQVVFALRSGARTVGELAETTGLEQSAVSHALRTLSDCELTRSTPEGKYRRYELTKTATALLALVDSHVQRHEITAVKPCCCT